MLHSVLSLTHLLRHVPPDSPHPPLAPPLCSPFLLPPFQESLQVPRCFFRSISSLPKLLQKEQGGKNVSLGGNRQPWRSFPVIKCFQDGWLSGNPHSKPWKGIEWPRTAGRLPNLLSPPTLTSPLVHSGHNKNKMSPKHWDFFSAGVEFRYRQAQTLFENIEGKKDRFQLRQSGEGSSLQVGSERWLTCLPARGPSVLLSAPKDPCFKEHLSPGQAGTESTSAACGHRWPTDLCMPAF